MEESFEIGEGTLSAEPELAQEQRFYASFDMLYDRTLADFQYCFFFYALNKYLKADIDKIQWSIKRHTPSEDLAPMLRKMRWEIKQGDSPQQRLQQYNNYCASLLFAERHHARFFQCLHQFACMIIAERSIANSEFFNKDETLQICRSITLMMDPHKATANQMEQAFQQDIEKYSGKHPYSAVRDRLEELLYKWEEQGDISEPGPRMKHYKYAGTRQDPSANAIYHTNFVKFQGKFDKLPENFQLPRPGLIRTPGMFKDIMFRDLVDHPETFQYSFAELGVDSETWSKLNISLGPDMFKNAQPQRDFVVTTLQSKQDTQFLNDIRANIYLMLRINNNLLGYNSFAVDITRAQGNQVAQFEISPDAHTRAFWNEKTIDFTSSIDKANWPRGAMVPSDHFLHIAIIDKMYLKLGITETGETYVRTPSEMAGLMPPSPSPEDLRSKHASHIEHAQEGREMYADLSRRYTKHEENIDKLLNKDNRVRFASNVDVKIIPRNKTVMKGAKVEGADDKKETPQTKKEKKDATNLNLIVGSILAFFGLYYIASD